MSAGALAVIKWNLNYLVYLIALLPLIMGILFIPADRGVSGAQSAAGETKKVRVGDLSRATWVYGAFTFLFMICYGVHSANIAFFVTEKNLGTAATVGHHHGPVHHRRHGRRAPPSSTSTRSLTPTPSASPTSCSSWASC